MAQREQLGGDSRVTAGQRRQPHKQPNRDQIEQPKTHDRRSCPTATSLPSAGQDALPNSDAVHAAIDLIERLFAHRVRDDPRRHPSLLTSGAPGHPGGPLRPRRRGHDNGLGVPAPHRTDPDLTSGRRMTRWWTIALCTPALALVVGPHLDTSGYAHCDQVSRRSPECSAG